MAQQPTSALCLCLLSFREALSSGNEGSEKAPSRRLGGQSLSHASSRFPRIQGF